MESYALPTATVNQLRLLVPPLHSWSLQDRLARVRQGNPNFRRGRWSRWRSKTEHQLASWLRQLPRIVGQLRAVGDPREDGAALLALAAALEQITPTQLGAIQDTRPRRGRSTYRTTWYVPANAMDNVRAFIGACRWASSFLARALGGVDSWLARVLAKAKPTPLRLVSVPKEVTSPYPSGTSGSTTRSEGGFAIEEWKRVIAEIGARHVEAVPPTTT